MATLLIFLVISVNGQIRTPCTTSMITSFTPCINYITGSTESGVSLTFGCCDSVRSLMGNGTDCMCLIITGNVPFSLPINRTLLLPRACDSRGVPLQCKGDNSSNYVNFLVFDLCNLISNYPYIQCCSLGCSSACSRYTLKLEEVAVD